MRNAASATPDQASVQSDRAAQRSGLVQLALLVTADADLPRRSFF